MAITRLGFHTLRVLRITGTTGQVVDLQARMCANLRCHQSPMGMAQLLYPGPDLTLKLNVAFFLSVAFVHSLSDNFIFTRCRFIQPQII